EAQPAEQERLAERGPPEVVTSCNGGEVYIDEEPCKSHLQSVLDMVIDRLPPLKLLALKEAVRNYSVRFGGLVTRASACTGCDIKAKVDGLLNAFYFTHFDSRVDSVHCLRSEINIKKPLFIRQMFNDATFIVGDMKGLQQDMVRDCISGTDRVAPHFVSFDVGFPCKSRTPLSAKCRENLNCCQKDTAETGKAVNCIFKIVEKNWPEEVLMECVVNLMQVGEGCLISDAAWITQQLSERGYWCIDTVVQALKQGSPVPRERIYWAAVRGIPKEKYVEASHFFLDILHAFNVGEMTPAQCNEVFLIKKTQLREGISDSCGLPVYAGTGLMSNQSKGPKASEPNYKTDHHQIFTASGFEWPVNWDGPRGADVPPDGLYARERESLAFLHWRFPFDVANGAEYAEFIEINTSLPRLLQGCVEPDSEYERFKKSPWRPTPGTLIGSGKIAVRYAYDGAIVVRLLEPVEYLRCIGWGSSFCEMQLFSQSAMHALNPPLTQASYADLIADMAGNAWSAYSYAAVRTALIATSGKYVPAQVVDLSSVDAADDVGASEDATKAGVDPEGDG
ncbi:unnamed protein product, partial [Prorocentrum cordatum]